MTSNADLLFAALDKMPLVAILRGIQPHEAADVAAVLVEAGFSIIEVPLNSPGPIDSIGRIANSVDSATLIGAGTVLEPRQVGEVADAGGRLIVMPHSDPEIIRTAKAAGLACVPGIATPTEAFAAFRNGADAVKLFPGEVLPPAFVKAIKAVLPADARLIPVGGIAPDSLAPYWAAGAAGFGIGSALYKPGKQLKAIAADASAFVAAMRAARGEPTIS